MDAEATMSDVDRKALKDAENAVKTYAVTYGEGSNYMNFGSLGAVKHENDAVKAQQNVLGKYPQLQQTLKEVGPIAVQKAERYGEQIAQWERQRRLAQLQPGPDTASNLERIDAKLDALKVQAKPYQQIANWARNPDSPEALKGVLGLKRSLGKAMENTEARMNEFMSEAEKGARVTREQQATKIHTDVIGPAEVEYATMQDIAANPEMSDEQKMGRLSFHAGEYKKRTGYMPNINEAGQRILPLRNQTQIMSSDERKTISEAETNVVTGEELLRDFKPEYVGPADSFTNSLRAKLPEGSPEFLKLSGEHQAFRQRVQLFLAQYRNKMFGASLSQNEQKAAEESMANLSMGDEQFPAALKEMIRWDKIMTDRIKANAGRKRGAESTPTAPGANPPAEKTFEAFKQWYQQNKDKYANPDDAAAAFHGG
jgi:hypothetical protein